MNKSKSLLIGSLLAASGLAQAAELDITVTNLTHGMHFTPLITAAHTADLAMFKIGEAASTELQMMAEGGDTSGLSSLLSGANADVNDNPVGGLLAPATSVTYMMTNSDGNNYLSMTAMLLPTNDGFVGLNSWKIPEEAGTYTAYLNAYDAGTEVNDEIINGGAALGAPGIPADPGSMNGSNGTGVTDTEANTLVHIHRGNLGDDDLNGGKSDVNNTVHRWLNPVAKITIVVK